MTVWGPVHRRVTGRGVAPFRCLLRSPDDDPRLWLTSFGMSMDGTLIGIDPAQQRPFIKSRAPLQWPNAVEHVPRGFFCGVEDPVLLIAVCSPAPYSCVCVGGGGLAQGFGGWLCSPVAAPIGLSPLNLLL